MRAEEIVRIDRNAEMKGQVALIGNIVYSEESGQTLNIFLPWSLSFPQIKTEARPLIVFVQGSGWTTPDPSYETAQLASFARRGYIVAMVSHRSVLDGFAFPTFLKDVKCAIRYLRAHANEYAIDVNRIAIWGTSSGGNTAQLIGLTGDDERYKTPEFFEYSDSVNAVVSCFGPTDVEKLFATLKDVPEYSAIVAKALGDDKSKWQEIEREVSPIHNVKLGNNYPPVMLLHGTADELVHHSQSVEMYEKLLKNGNEAYLCLVDGASHENDFWGEEVYTRIGEFLDSNI